MNTSHNKERIVDDGWKNVFKNLLWKGSSIPAISHTNHTPENPTFKRHLEPQKGRHKPRPNSLHLSKIRKRKTNIAIVSDMTNCNIQPSTSKGQKQSPKHKAIFHHHQLDNQTINTNDRSTLCKDLIVKMKENVENEEEYMKYFQHFVQHVSSLQVESITNQLPSEYDSLPNFVPDNSCQSRRVKCKGKKLHNIARARSKNRSKTIINVEDLDVAESRFKFVGLQKDRIRIRKIILSELDLLIEDEDEERKRLIERLINKEEEFIS